MSTKLYLVRTHKISFTNIFTALVTNALAGKVYNPCEYKLTGKFISNREGKFTTDFPHPNIRHIIWNDQTPKSLFQYLEYCFQESYQKRQVLALGCHDSGSVDYLCKKYSPNVLSLGLYYTQDDYPVLLKHAAEYHVHMLRNNILTPSDNDRQLISTLSDLELIDYYIAAFDSDNLVPRESEPTCQFNFRLSDIMNPNLVNDFFNKLDLPLNQVAQDFYNSWLSAYSDL